MSKIKIEAATRLNAATDVKGAAAFVQKIFDTHKLGIKVKAVNDEYLQCKGRLGEPFEFRLFLVIAAGKTVVAVDSVSTYALYPPDEGIDTSIIGADFTDLSKGGIKDVSRTVKDIEKVKKLLDQEAAKVGEQLDWWKRFLEAFKELAAAKGK